LLYQKSFNLYLFAFFLLVVALPTFGTAPHPFSEEALAKGLPEKIGDDWRAITSSNKVIADRIPENPETKVLAEYGLQSVTARQYTNGKDNLRVESFAMKHPLGAYGLWTLRRSSLPEGEKEFFIGRYLVHISAPTSILAETVMPQLHNNLTLNSEIPLLPTYLPEQNKLAASEKYVIGPEAISRIPEISHLKNIIDFTGGTHAAVADYTNGGNKMSVILIEFQSPQFATDGLLKMQQYFNSLSPDEQKKRILRRVGNYAVEAVNVADAKSAEELLSQIKYMARVHWEGKGLSAIPLQFRPPDPVSLREAMQTGQFIVAAFYWIGVLILGALFAGIFTGGAFFYWRRAQRRKQGVSEMFSDAGGMTRLNL
jgi:hypothetical protein